MNKNVSFIKNIKDIENMRNLGETNNYDWFLNQGKITFAWEIDQKLYENLLPQPLEPVMPVVFGFVAYFPQPGGCLYPYKEGGLFLYARYNGVVGAYCLAMPVDGKDMGIFLGRELFNYPKKVANISLRRNADECYASIERNGIKYFEIKGTFGQPNDPQKLDEAVPVAEIGQMEKAATFLIDYKIKCPGENDYNQKNLYFDDVVLNSQMNEFITRSSEDLSVEVTLRTSEDDPWAELAPVRVLGARWSIYETRMCGTNLVKQYTKEEIKALEPYLFNKFDTNFFGHPHVNY